jgi:hypothetical protein
MTETLLTHRRDHIIDRMSSAYANGAFEVEELERRLALVHAAQTPAELEALATDLVPAGASTALEPVRRMRIVMGSLNRTGPWSVPAQLAARVLWGNLLLDLREAKLGPGQTTIEINLTMGNVDVIVPPGVEVEIDASSFLGNIEQRTERSLTTGSPVVRIVGRVKLGNLEVATLRLGETQRDARHRHRDERRARRHWRRRAMRW